MAKETFVRLTDDLDGTEAVESVSFALRGTEYEVDLSAKNVAALEKALDKYIAKGRKASSGHARTPRRRARAVAPTVDASGIREWARANGFEVSDRGRVPAAVREAYEASQ